ncbi:MAG TPA: HEAT repeat domain-containing protein [Candidatus Acidoferrum sp.]|nr:HEAT repeat domain-containing protein [Candidatus Acidoferrum sp.]
MRALNLIGIAGIFCGGLLCGAHPAAGQTKVPETANTRIELHAAGPDLRTTMKDIVATADGPMWIGYEVASVPGNHGDCCGDYGERANGQSNRVWHLERERGSGSESIITKDEVKLEGGKDLWILYRADKRKIERIRTISGGCRLDAGGLRLIWLEDVKSTGSVAFLSGFVQGRENSGSDDHRISEQALTAIALHADAAADKALEGFSAPGQPEGLRKRTSFWMGVARGAAGKAQLEKMARTDPSSKVREQVSFALYVSKEPGATEEIIRMAREDESAHVRGQALFWLAQKAGAKAENAISEAITNDPDTEVKKKAVFALSQMPKDEGVPKLIEVAERNKNLEVRKQAMFWLGQSEDPRALAFFERVLRN